MNKQIVSLLLCTSIIFSINAASSPFGKLTQLIEASADRWIGDLVSKLDITQQVVFANLFIQPSSNSVETTMKCLQHIQSDAQLTEASQRLEQDTHKILQSYITHMQKKFEALQKTLSKAAQEKSKQEFFNKFEKKIYELIMHIYSVYYVKLYQHIEKQNPAALCYLFDEQGLIAPEKRTKVLPKP